MLHISEVTDATEDAFIGLPYKLYKNDPSFIAPLQGEIKKIFNPKTNSFLSMGIVPDGFYLMIKI